MENGYFSNLNNKQKIFVCTFPQYVSVTKNPDEETFDQIAERQDRFLELPSIIIDKISSIETSEIIQDIGRNFNLQLLQLADISRVIRSYYFGEVKLEDFSNILAREIPADINIARQISEQIIQRIIRNDSLKISGINKNFVNISLLQAMRAYPNLGEQLVTSNSIHLKIFPQLVRPSIKNWVEDYRSVMGAERHGMMERGNYLFHTENTKRLTSGERKKLAEILRSLDEDVTLKIDPDRQEIIFEQAEEMKPIEKMTNYQNNSLSSSDAGGLLDKKENVQNISRSNFQTPKQQIPNYPQSNPLLKSDDRMRASQNIPNQNFQSLDKESNSNMRFSSPHTFPSEKKNEPAKTPFQQFSKNTYNNSGMNSISNQMNRKSGYVNPQAGKPWEPASTQRSEPKVNGNTVDLRN